jgi:hypothetical protein
MEIQSPLLLPVLLREITNSALERRLFTWFINEYVEYFEIESTMLAKAHMGHDRIILFLYSCDDQVVIRQDGSWDVFSTIDNEQEEVSENEVIYSVRDLIASPIFREVLEHRFQHPFTIEYSEKGVDITW